MAILAEKDTILKQKWDKWKKGGSSGRWEGRQKENSFDNPWLQPTTQRTYYAISMKRFKWFQHERQWQIKVGSTQLTMGNLIAERRISQMVGERISRLVAILFTKLPHLLIVKRENQYLKTSNKLQEVFSFSLLFFFLILKSGKKKTLNNSKQGMHTLQCQS